MKLRSFISRLLGITLLAGWLAGCATAPKAPLFVDVAAWPMTAQSVALVGVSFDKSYRPLPQSGLDREISAQVRRVLERKGYLVTMAVPSDRLERRALTSVSAEELAGRAGTPVDLVLAVHVDFLFSSATYGESNPPPEFEIAAEARVVDRRTKRDLWRDRGHALTGGASAMPLRDPDYDRLRGVTELADSLLETLPDAGMRPEMSPSA